MSVLIPGLKEAFRTCVRRNERITRRVAAVAEFGAALATYRPFESSFVEKFTKWDAAKHAASVALGRLRVAETGLDNQLRIVAWALRGADGGARRSVQVQIVYPQGYGAALGSKGEEALRTARGVLQRISENTHPDVVARREPLAAAIAAVEAEMLACSQAFDALELAKADLVTERNRWRHAFIAFYFDCVKVFPDKRSYVNRLFRFKSIRWMAEEVVELEPEAGGTGEGESTDAEFGEITTPSEPDAVGESAPAGETPINPAS